MSCSRPRTTSTPSAESVSPAARARAGVGRARPARPEPARVRAAAACLGLDVHMGRMLDVLKALQHVDIGARARSTTPAARCSCTGVKTSAPSIEPSTPSGAGATLLTTSASDDREHNESAGERSSAVEMLGDASAGEGEGGALRTWSAASRARVQGLRRVHGRRDGRGECRARSRWSGTPESAGRAAGSSAPARASTFGVHWQAAFAPAAT